MTSLNLADGDPSTAAVDAVVVGVFDDGDGVPQLAPGAEQVSAALNGGLADALRRLGATGAVGEVTKLATFGAIKAPVLVAVGLGADDGEVSAETLRRAAGAATRALAGSDRVVLALPGALRPVAEGALLGAYRFAGYRTRPQAGRREAVKTVSVRSAEEGTKAAARAMLKRATTVTGAVAQARDWINAAPNELRPPAFADAIAAWAGTAGLDVEVLDEKALKKGGYGGILAVGQGSAAPPRFVRLAYTARGATSRLALVGKGITFDTGGVSIKPAANMWEMKSDMSGAAAVAAAVVAIAALGPKVNVTAYVPIAENMPSGTSYRPGDVVTMRDGTRVEVLNTDAEGRMVLADAMARAIEDGTDYLLETSTLTGGQIIALGKRVSGLMGTEDFCNRVRDIGARVGEPAWPMPLPDDVRKGMDSEVADISQVNAGMDRAGHMLQGGVFLSHFVPDDLPWAHLDIAGPSYNAGEPTGYLPKGGTGVPVRTLIELAEDVAANG
ncbi:leucyl aminopeptidase [Virgisporangium ochraceum]|uniref:Probable cytosol aminopeptidase n=1 Tax=Virgisporangium ochraceum TaxID=65505 RepID=A0A8J3ZRS9_9ACTN|nr:leucyl aminopeptidase [Virgisporangium ochraceum]GIJ68744.1 putative cytosol aminopeptidase [Virgisporangium ochraceum]